MIIETVVWVIIVKKGSLRVYRYFLICPQTQTSFNYVSIQILSLQTTCALFSRC